LASRGRPCTDIKLQPSLSNTIDGKTARGSHDRGQAAIHMVSAFMCGRGITLGRWKTDAKSNELEGATVTLDAMWCQSVLQLDTWSRHESVALAPKLEICKLRS
jgi:hypothetical protein